MKQEKTKSKKKGYNPKKIERPKQPSEVEPEIINNIIKFCKGIDFNTILPNWSSGRSGPKKSNPEFLLRIWIYNYQHKMISGRQLSKELRRNIDLQYLSEGNLFSFSVINKFRSSLEGKEKELLDALRIWNGEPQGNLSLDGTQISSSGSKYQFRQTKDLKRLLEKHNEKAKLGNKRSLKRIIEYQKALDYIKNYPNIQRINLRELDSRIIRHGNKITLGYNVLTVCDERRRIYGIMATNTNRESEAFKIFFDSFEHRINKNESLLLMDSDFWTIEILEYLNSKNMKALINVRKASTENKIKEQNRFSKNDFNYDKIKDIFICPNGKELSNRGVKISKRRNGSIDRRHNYLSSKSDCRICKMKSKCLSVKTPYRNITISLSENIVNNQKKLLEDNKELMKTRWSTIEVVFGILKGSHSKVINRFILKGLKRVSIESVLMAISKDIRLNCRVLFFVLFLFIKNIQETAKKEIF